MDWGFERFRTIRPAVANLEPTRIWKGSKKIAALVPGDRLEFTVPAHRARSITYAVTRYPGIAAPIPKGTELGELVFSDEEGVLKRIPLVAAEEVALGNPIRRLADTITLFFLRLFGKTA